MCECQRCKVTFGSADDVCEILFMAPIYKQFVCIHALYAHTYIASPVHRHFTMPATSFSQCSDFFETTFAFLLIVNRKSRLQFQLQMFRLLQLARLTDCVLAANLAWSENQCSPNGLAFRARLAWEFASGSLSNRSLRRIRFLSSTWNFVFLARNNFPQRVLWQIKKFLHMPGRELVPTYRARFASIKHSRTGMVVKDRHTKVYTVRGRSSIWPQEIEESRLTLALQLRFELCAGNSEKLSNPKHLSSLL